MKKLALLLVLVFLTGCASFVPMGMYYTEGKMGLQDNGGAATKTGRACMKSVLGMVSTGDASVAAAKVNGGITKVATIDYEVENILGVIGEYCLVVTGS